MNDELYDDGPELDEVPDDPQPPQDLPAERAVLGSVLLSPVALSQVAGALSGDDFYRPSHGVIWAEAMRMWNAGEPVDAVAVATALDRAGTLQKVGGAPYLHTLISEVPTAANVTYYAASVAEKATLRRVSEAGDRIRQLAEAGGRGADVDEVLAFVHRAVEEATTGHGAGTALVPAESAVWSFIDSLSAPPVGIVATPWPMLDDILSGGFRVGELVVVAARTSVGKSLVGAAIARRAAEDGLPTVLFTMEMDRDEVMARLVADVGGISLSSLIEHNLMASDAVAAKVAAEHIAGLPLWVDDTPAVTVAQVRARCQQLGDVGLVVVDQLSLMTPSDSRATTEQQLSRLAWELKVLAQQLGCPVVVLHQLNKGPTQRMNAKPALHDLRGSDAIGHHAHRVFLLWRNPDTPWEIVVIVAKNRSGPTGEVELRFDGRYARVSNGDFH